ncbi:hypothetical protein MVEN_02232500 [Mycena venus]|uniref:F-box domain-containing protein n=1 Tax=Mycena venus TaxID=2733690 RepID=A0A8H6X7X1_9AGAR|nr:hypothetical protein MVEN_02232500 [Mycena venus]
MACSETTLESFTLENRAHSFPPAAMRANYMIIGRCLHILTCFGNVKTRSISSPVGLDLDDDLTLARLAAAWPRMESLALETSLMNLPSGMTLQDLHALAVQCPQLYSLDMEFNPSPAPSLIGHACMSQYRMRYLDVGGSPITRESRPPSIARFLSSLFPNLARISTPRENEDNEDPEEIDQHQEAIARHLLWKQVQDEIPEFVAARREEHNWARV